MGYLRQINYLVSKLNLSVIEKKKLTRQKIAEHESKSAFHSDLQLMYLIICESQKPNNVMYLNREANKARVKSSHHRCKSKKHCRRDTKKSM